MRACSSASASACRPGAGATIRVIGIGRITRPIGVGDGAGGATGTLIAAPGNSRDRYRGRLERGVVKRAVRRESGGPFHAFFGIAPRACVVRIRAAPKVAVWRFDADFSTVLVALWARRRGSSGEPRRRPVAGASGARRLLPQRVGLLCGIALFLYPSLRDRVSGIRLQQPVADRRRPLGRDRATASALNGRRPPSGGRGVQRLTVPGTSRTTSGRYQIGTLSHSGISR